MTTTLALTFLALGSFALQAQQYTISTIAGGGAIPASAPASSITIAVSFGIAVSSGGDIYFSSNNAVMKVDSSGMLTRIAGTGEYGVSADGGSAASSRLAWPGGLAIDSAGNLYIAENAVHRVRKVSPQGVLSTVAGTGSSGYSGDGGPALSAQLSWPTGLALDAIGDLFIADTGNQVVRKVTAKGAISTIATGFRYNTGVAVDQAGKLYATDESEDDGGDPLGYLFQIAPDGATSQLLGPEYLAAPSGVAVDSSGGIYIADPGNGAVIKVNGAGAISMTNSYAVDVATDGTGSLYISNGRTLLTRTSPTGTVTNLTGSGATGNYWGDGGKAVDAGLSQPLGIAVDKAGNLYISDSGNNRVRKVAPDGSIVTMAGTGVPGFSGDGGPALAAQLSTPSGLALDAAGNLYIADRGNNRIRKVSTDGTIRTVAGRGDYNPPLGDGGLATNAALAGPFGVAVDASGDLYIADTSFFLLRKVSPSGVITTVAGSDYYQKGPNQIGYPLNTAVDQSGNVYISTQDQILELSTPGALSIIAGNTINSVPPPSGDGGPAVNATLLAAAGIALDSRGNLWISGGNLSGFPALGAGYIREITTDGIIHTIVGNSAVGYSGDGGPASQATISASAGPLAIDGAGTIYFADIFNNVVRVLRAVN